MNTFGIIEYIISIAGSRPGLDRDVYDVLPKTHEGAYDDSHL